MHVRYVSGTVGLVQARSRQGFGFSRFPLIVGWLIAPTEQQWLHSRSRPTGRWSIAKLLHQHGASGRAMSSAACRSVAARSVAAAACSTRRSSSSSALRLGDLQLKSDVLLAPLERVSDVGFRRLCFRHGAGLTWTEMVYASDLARGKTASCDLIDTHDPSTLTGVQILVDRTTARDGWGVDCLRAALEALEAGAAGARPEWRNIRAIDLNFGCPDPAVSARGAGPAQLRRRSKVRLTVE